jgi:hypothetical protein
VAYFRVLFRHLLPYISESASNIVTAVVMQTNTNYIQIGPPPQHKIPPNDALLAGALHQYMFCLKLVTKIERDVVNGTKKEVECVL